MSAPSPSPPGALQSALAAEHAACYGYGIVGAHLQDMDRRMAREAWDVHRRRRNELRQFVRTRGMAPTPAEPSYELPLTVDGPDAAVRLAVRLEEGLTRTYTGLVAVTDPQLRHYAARATQDCSIWVLRWNGSPGAFPGLPKRVIS